MTGYCFAGFFFVLNFISMIVLWNNDRWCIVARLRKGHSWDDVFVDYPETSRPSRPGRICGYCGRLELSNNDVRSDQRGSAAR
jgi:hypothetical protein